MPKYTFICEKCDTLVQKYTSRDKKAIKCKCGGSLQRQLPRPNKADVEETIDKYMGTKQRPDQREVVQQRRDEYYWTIEVPRLVNSGTYSVETMLEMGWIYLDEKNQIQINTSPPHKR